MGKVIPHPEHLFPRNPFVWLVIIFPGEAPDFYKTLGDLLKTHSTSPVNGHPMEARDKVIGLCDVRAHDGKQFHLFDRHVKNGRDSFFSR